MKKYITLAKTSFIGTLVNRFHLFAMFITNIAYIIIMYYLWKAIYESNPHVSDVMGFESTFLYLSLSSCMYYVFQSWVEYDLSSSIITGKIAVELTKPYDYQVYWIYRILGFVICKFIVIGIPSFLVICCMIKGKVLPGSQVLIGAGSLVLSYLISINIDYIAGMISFYTQSVWGVNIVKETLILLLSGLSVPLAFYPKVIRNIVMLLPFSSIYNTPMSIILSRQIQEKEILTLLGIQAFWTVAIYFLAKIIYCRGLFHTIINGG